MNKSPSGLFLPPEGLTLGQNYSDETLESINTVGGKQGLLDMVYSLDRETVADLENLGFYLDKRTLPITLSEGEIITESEYELLFNNFKSLFDEFGENLFGRAESYLSNTVGDVLIRCSCPGDFRSLVDVLDSPTIIENDSKPLYFPSRDKINQGLKLLREEITRNKGDISSYAYGTNVPYSEETISFSVVPKLNTNQVIVTENPNNDDLYIDVDSSGIRSSVDTKTTFLTNRIKNLKKVLVSKGILDETIAYQFELGGANGGLYLYQIKEFGKKTETYPSFLSEYSDMVNRIISGSANFNFELPLVYGMEKKDGFDAAKKIKGDVCLALSENRGKLSPGDYSPNIAGFVHGDTQGGLFNHNSFRMSQATIQRGGFTLLCDLSFTRSYIGLLSEKPGLLVLSTRDGVKQTFNFGRS